ncbi:MAG TPA: prepilin-type N-terminal cleavage/methylation domain-containing protein [Candidatus Margulisiibacteriota bacterium]|nr:prepilin-type N-terminal cleavage/methylation domain-containing protein [Candidatus Margulisiibacteriota bacterium]
MHRKYGFSFIELLIVVIIIGVLVSFAAPQFAVTKERALDKEAQANLRLIQAAERIYKMEISFYYPYSGSANRDGINTDLKLSLPAVNWGYAAYPTGQSVATRTGSDGRTWTLNIDSEDFQSGP